MKKLRCVVSGSAGFLGSNLVQRLKKDGHEVISWDIVNGYDICNPNLKAKNIDAIFHLACPVNPANYESVALDTIMASSEGTNNMLKLALKNKAKFLYVSSSEIYGEIYERPYKENDLVTLDPRGERTFYDSSKLLGEVLTMTYNRYKNVDIRIIRPFNIYGQGMRKDDTRVIHSFIRRIKEGKPIQVTGKGEATRTFCYIDDFIEGTMRSMFCPNTNGEVFNLGTTELVKIMDLAKMLDAKIEFTPARKSEQKDRKPNILKAKKILGWIPKISLKKGLELMWTKYP